MASDHDFLVGSHHSNLNGAGITRDYRRALGIAVGIERQAKKIESSTDLLANCRRVLANTRGENQQIQTSEDGDEGPEVLAGLIAIKREGLGRGTVALSRLKEIASVGARSGYA